MFVYDTQSVLWILDWIFRERRKSFLLPLVSDLFSLGKSFLDPSFVRVCQISLYGPWKSSFRWLIRSVCVFEGVCDKLVSNNGSLYDTLCLSYITRSVWNGPGCAFNCFWGLYTVYSDIKYFVHIPHCPVRIENTVSEGLTLCGCFSIFFDF